MGNTQPYISFIHFSTARIWDVSTGNTKHVLSGHAYAVAVLSLPNGIIITGSQDKNIRIWYNGK